MAKPSEYATFAVLRLAALMSEAGLPPGVLNIVTGPGEPTGQALISHPMVDKLVLHRQRAVGRKIVAASADGFKRVSLELGGKSPALVFADADVPRRRRSPWARSPSACPGRSAWRRPGRWCSGTWPTSSWRWPR